MAEKKADAKKAGGGGAGGDRPRLMLLDGHSMAYRAFYALKEGGMTTSVGQPTFAVYGFASMLANTLRDERPTHFAVAFDVSRRTFRTEEFPEYKANRAETPDEFRSQVELINEMLDAMNVPHLALEGFEADDIIATLATEAAADGYEVFIVTGDRDALQLVTDDVTVLYPTRGVSELTRFTPAKVEEKYGLTPAQYPDFAALRGDPSDNLPGIPKVGEKTATKWIVQYGSLQELVEHADEIKGVVGTNLRDNLDSVLRNRRLTELVRDVELELGPGELARKPFDRQALDVLMDALEFRNDNFRGRVLAVDPAGLGAEAAAAETAEAGPSIAGRALAPGELAGWLQEHGGERVAVAADYTWELGAGDVAEVALAVGSGPAAAFRPERLDGADESALTAWLADAGRKKAVHLGKHLVRVFAERGWPLAGVEIDTALASYLDEPGARPFETDPPGRHRRDRAGRIRFDKSKRQLTELEVLVEDVLHRELPRAAALGAAGNLTEEDGQQAFDFDAAEQEEGANDRAASEALMLEARAVSDLADHFGAKLAGSNALELMRDLELPLGDVLVGMERVGIAADRPALERLVEQYQAEADQAVAEAHKVVGHPLNLGSPKQLQEVLFEELGLPKTKKTKTGYTTDADALAWLAGQTDNELPVIVLRHRDRNRLKTTVEGLIKTVAPDGRIHTTFNQMVAATGRLSSTDPNLQNIPVRTEDGRHIRRAFVVGEGYESLLTADYSQIELRVMAHVSEDAGLLEAFRSGEDLHNAVASQVFGVPPEKVDAEMRRKIKAMSYGLAYGLSAFGLSGQLGVSAEEARTLMDTYFERFGGVRDYLRRVVDEARATGFTETLLGRRRYLPDLNSDNRQRREMAERMALNAPIQGSAADIVKLAMLKVDRALAGEGLRSRMLLQVHDEIVVEVAPGEREAVERLVRKEMSGAYPLKAPLDVSVGDGANWEDAAH
ncbi:DNA polymerase I [Mangrovactinospora gilvigrisea]|nr:DNA polymerase I [Mangrovactinospora gilvigrisea]